MSAMDRIRSEQIFHDRQARERFQTFLLHPERYLFYDDAYLDHETWLRPAFARMGEVRGLDVLDYGCGHGMAAVVLARRGARVTAFDLSHGYIDEAHHRAQANQVDVQFVQADGERLPFADGSFDRVWGNAILHHLDLHQAGPELHRILRPNSMAVFCEPWGENPLLRWARQRLHYPGKHRTIDEQPLLRHHLSQLRQTFSKVEVKGFQLVSMARRLLRPRLVASLDWCDQMLLERIPGLQHFCRYIVLTLIR